VSRGRATTATILAVAALGAAACGDDGTSDSGSGGSSGQGGAAPGPAGAFGPLTTALEGQGLAVSKLPPSELDGAETGIAISGQQSGSARLFATEQQADAYAGRAGRAGSATTTVGTVVFEAGEQQDADTFADAYED